MRFGDMQQKPGEKRLLDGFSFKYFYQRWRCPFRIVFFASGTIPGVLDLSKRTLITHRRSESDCGWWQCRHERGVSLSRVAAGIRFGAFDMYNRTGVNYACITPYSVCCVDCACITLYVLCQCLLCIGGTESLSPSASSALSTVTSCLPKLHHSQFKPNKAKE